MSFDLLRLRALARVVFVASFGVIAGVSAQAAELPESLVLRFEDGVSELEQVAIRDAVVAELGIPVGLEGSEKAATLSVGRAPTGDVRVSFRPARDELTRTIPVTDRSDLPKLVALLAGNLVRSEAQQLLAELSAEEPATRPPSSPVATAAPAAAPAAAQPAPATPVRPNDDAAPYLDDAWIFSALAGAVWSGDEQMQLSLQLSRRIGRLELATGARLGFGRVDAEVYGSSGSDGATRVSSYQVTLPLSAELRVLGRDEAYLQLGGYLGYRLAGFMNQSESVASGSTGDVAYGFQLTTGFRLAKNHGLMLRVLWELGPEVHSVSSADEMYYLDPLAPIVQFGWQIGW